VDPPGAKPAALLQRTGLTLDAGRVLFAMGGNFGDCSTYRGRVGAVSETGGTPSFFTADAGAGQSQGAIWMGGAAPAIDANGNIWVTVGNGSITSADQPYDDSDAALELSPSLQLLQYFAPTTWAQDNADDLDLSVEPTLLSNGQVVVSGKSRIIDLLDGTHLGGIGGELTSLASGCAQNIDGGSAVVGTTVYLPCLSGPIALQVVASPPSLNVLWKAAVGGGPPIVAAGRVWTIGQDGTLYGLDPTSGKVMQQASIGVPANHFPTPSVGDGLLLAASVNHVVAFRATTASASTTTPSTTSGSSTTTSTRATASPAPTSKSGGSGGLSGAVIVLIVAAGVLLLGGISWLVRRRTTARRP
jgi:polyvinyl alcohol dehydrogenase (cytochrome)